MGLALWTSTCVRQRLWVVSNMFYLVSVSGSLAVAPAGVAPEAATAPPNTKYEVRNRIYFVRSSKHQALGSNPKLIAHHATPASVKTLPASIPVFFSLAPCAIAYLAYGNQNMLFSLSTFLLLLLQQHRQYSYRCSNCLSFSVRELRVTCVSIAGQRCRLSLSLLVAHACKMP